MEKIDRLLKKNRKRTRAILMLGPLFFFVFLFFGLVARSSFAVAAAVPDVITYQGKLLLNNASVTTTVPIQFVLYDTPSAGTILYTASGTIGAPAATAVTPNKGLFSVELGGSGTNPLDAGVVFKNNSSVYLEVTVNGETLSPRKRLTASPYAFNAKYLDGIAATSTPTSSAYIPVADSSGNFSFNRVTSTGFVVSGTSTLATTTISSSTIGVANVGNLFLTNATGTNLFVSSLSASSSVFSSVTSSNFSVTGNLDITTAVILGLSTADLSDSSSLAYLVGANTFTGPNTFSGNTTLATTTISSSTIFTANINSLNVLSSLSLPVASILEAYLAPNSVSSTTLKSTGVVAGTYGSATQTAQFVVDEDGRILSATNVTIISSSTSPSSSFDGTIAAGDLSGTYPNPTVSKINGNTLGNTAITGGNILVASSTAGWTSVALGGDATIDSSGLLSITNNTVTVAKLVAGDFSSKINTGTYSINVTGTASNVTGVVALANGGTNANASFFTTPGEFIIYDGSRLVGAGFSSSSFALTSHTHSAADITAGIFSGVSYTFANDLAVSGFSTFRTTTISSSSITTANINSLNVFSALTLPAASILEAYLAPNSVSSTALKSTGVASGIYGSATEIAQFVVDEDGRILSASNVSIAASVTTTVTTTLDGTAGGDLSGTYPDPTVSKINGNTLGNTATTSGHILVASSTAGWTSVALGGDATIDYNGLLSITNNTITAAKLAAGDFSSKINAGTYTISVTGTADNVTGVVAIANGGTNANASHFTTPGEFVIYDGSRLVGSGFTSSSFSSGGSHTHPASDITAGTFGGSSYVFANDLAVLGSATFATATVQNALQTDSGLFLSQVGLAVPNLLTNPSFESGITNWGDRLGFLGGSTYSVTSTAYSGSSALQLEARLDLSGFFGGPPLKIGYFYHDTSNVTQSASSTISFYARGAVGGEHARILIERDPGTGQAGCGGSLASVYNFTTGGWDCVDLQTSVAAFAVASPNTQSFSLTTSYQRFNATFNPGAYGTVQISILAGGASAYNDEVVLYDAFKLEAGSTPSSFDGGSSPMFALKNNNAAADYNSQTSLLSVQDSAATNFFQIMGDGRANVGSASVTGSIAVFGRGSEQTVLNGYGQLLSRGAFGSDDTLTSATGSQFIWYPKRGAFRAGYTDTLTWGDNTIGNYSFAAGNEVSAPGVGAIAFGKNVTVTGANSVAFSASSTLSTVANDNIFSLLGYKVGIGTVNPATALVVVGTTTLENLSVTGSTTLDNISPTGINPVLTVTGGLKLGYVGSAALGTLRWSGSRLEWYDGSSWVATSLPAATDNGTTLRYDGAEWVTSTFLRNLYSSSQININNATGSAVLAVRGSDLELPIAEFYNGRSGFEDVPAILSIQQGGGGSGWVGIGTSTLDSVWEPKLLVKSDSGALMKLDGGVDGLSNEISRTLLFTGLGRLSLGTTTAATVNAAKVTIVGEGSTGATNPLQVLRNDGTSNFVIRDDGMVFVKKGSLIVNSDSTALSRPALYVTRKSGDISQVIAQFTDNASSTLANTILSINAGGIQINTTTLDYYSVAGIQGVGGISMVDSGSSPGVATGPRFLWSGSKFRVGTFNSEFGLGADTIALGTDAYADQIEATALGLHALATGRRSLVLGNGTASGDFSTAIGNAEFVSVGHDKANSFNVPEASGYGAIAIGSGSISQNFGAKTLAAGTSSLAIFGIASGTQSVALWGDASGDNSMAFGRYTSITASGAVVLGRGVDSNNPLLNTTNNSLAVGFNSDVPTFFVGGGSGVGTYGQVGIGTTNTAYTLDVRGTFGATGTSTLATTTITAVASSLIPTEDNVFSLGTSLIRWKDLYVSSSSLHIGADGAEGSIHYNTDDHYLSFNAGSGIASQLVIVSSTGFVGIGTTTPNAVLTVGGGAYLDGGLEVTGSATSTGDQYVGGNLSVIGLSHFANLTWDSATGTSVFLSNATAIDAMVGNLTVTSTLDVSAATITGLSTSDLSDANTIAYLAPDQTFTGQNNFTNRVTIATATVYAFESDLLASEDDLYSLGSSTNRWRKVFAKTGIFGTAGMNDPLTISESGIVANGMMSLSVQNIGAGGVTLSSNGSASLQVTGNNISLNGDLATVGGGLTVVNTSTLATTTISGNLGIGTTTPAYRLTLDGDGVIVAHGEFGVGADAPDGPGTRLVWLPQKAAFRAGVAEGGQFDNANIGNYSTAFGLNVTSSGAGSFVTGVDNDVTGDYSFGTGRYNSVSGIYSAAFGVFNTVSGSISVALGSGNHLNKVYSYVLGSANILDSESSFVLGEGNIIDGQPSATVLGVGNVLHDGGVAIGHINQVTSSGFAAGYANRVEGNNYAFGYGNVIGNGNVSSTNSAFAFGNNLNITGGGGFAIGSGVSIHDLLVNDIADSLFVGFNSNLPTLFVGPSNGVGTFGSVGIGTTNTLSILTVNGDVTPALDGVYSLGTSTYRWKDLYLSSSSLHIGENGNEGVLSWRAASSAFSFNSDAVFQQNVTIGNATPLAISGAALAVVGDTRITGIYQNFSVDVAENYSSLDFSIEAGDLVSVDPVNREHVIKTNHSYQDSVVGIISSKPGVLLGWGTENAKSVALSGRVPVKVTNINGNISIGDKLTSSDIPGVAMKATADGPTIGIALENYSSLAVGKIIAMVNLSWNNIAATKLTVSSNNNTLTVGSSSSTYNLAVTGDLRLTGSSTNTISFANGAFLTSAAQADSGAVAFTFNGANFTTNTNAYLLSLRSGGSSVFSVAGNGDIHTVGSVYANSVVIGTPGTPGDLAERVDIAPDDNVEAGDVMVVDEKRLDTYRRSTAAYAQAVAGVISTNPTIVVGNGKTDYNAVLAMVGRVPVKVSSENGAIKRGDLLVAATTTGHAMRYDASKDNGDSMVGVVGIALESFTDSGTGKIMALIRTGWVNSRNATISNLLEQTATILADRSAVVSEGNLSVGGNGEMLVGRSDLDVANYRIINVSGITGKNNRWTIDEHGNFISRVQTSVGDKDLYGLQSPSSEYVFSSSSQLVAGEAHVEFDTPSQEIIDGNAPLKVIVTLTSGGAKGVYVSEKNAHGFVVKELDGGVGEATFDWMVIAQKKSVEEVVPEVVAPEVVSLVVPVSSESNSTSSLVNEEVVNVSSTPSSGGSVEVPVISQSVDIVSPASSPEVVREGPSSQNAPVEEVPVSVSAPIIESSPAPSPSESPVSDVVNP